MVRVIRPRKLLAKVRRAKFASTIKYYVVTFVAKSGSNMSAVREKIKSNKRVTKLTPAICEDWATGLGLQGLMFTDYDILQFFIATLGIKVDEQTDDCLYGYGVSTYTYDLQEVVDFYWNIVGEALCWC